jgi:hypothetical protein
MATADPWHDFDGGCVGERCCYDHRLEDWNWSIWFHAPEPHGLGWTDPGLSVDDDYCGITGNWLRSNECEEMECGWSIGALRPSNRGSLFIRRIRVDGSARNCPSGYCVPLCLALFGNTCRTLSGSEPLVSARKRLCIHNASTVRYARFAERGQCGVR